jgi:hypothetical protein
MQCQTTRVHQTIGNVAGLQLNKARAAAERARLHCQRQRNSRGPMWPLVTCGVAVRAWVAGGGPTRVVAGDCMVDDTVQLQERNTGSHTLVISCVIDCKYDETATSNDRPCVPMLW